MKTSKKIISLVLCAVMVLSTFCGLGFVLDDFKAEAAITLGGITQQRVVATDNNGYEDLYRSYQKRFFKGEETNWPTNFVIPGLGSADDYTPQGMTYWKAKEWILISAYDAGGSDPSVIYALDVVTTNMVAVFKIQNADGTNNTSHGGGIAASEYNFYYADDASKISYIPLSEMDVEPETVKTIKLRDSINLAGEMNGSGTAVKTSYCCYDEGVLWTGNFYISSDDRYNTTFMNDYAQTLMGYKLAGNSSEEEWYYLKNGYNLVKLNVDNAAQVQTSGALTYRTYNVDGANAEIRGTVTTDASLGEVTASFASVNLTEGKTYKIEFIADNNFSDMYMFAPKIGDSTPHCNVKQSQASKITDLGNGKYHYQMIFTAGLKPAGADSSWPTTQSTNGTYTGTYTIRFDQDNVPAGGRTFNITDFSVTQYVEPQGFTPNSKYEGIGCQGNPTYVVLLNMDKIQYAMVDKGKIYISRSWSRTESANHSRDLVIGDIDLTMPGNENRTINGRTRPVHIINYADCIHFGGDKGASTLGQMLYMGEALCVIEDYLYMFGEGAAWTYNGKESNKCTEPIDVIWKIDQYAIQGLTRPHEDVTSVEYEKVNSLSEINSTDEYIILHESPEKDPVTQDNIIYLLNSYGGYGDTKLPKKADSSNVTAANTGDSRGLTGYEIRDYSVKKENGKTSIILNAEDDANKSLHWQFESASSSTLKLKNRDLYYAKNPYFYSGDTLFAMTTTADSNMRIKDLGNGNFKISGGGETYPIWCNDGSVPASVTNYSNFYSNHSQSGYAPNYHNLEEVVGTFHVQNNSQPATGTNEQMVFHIYKRISDPYTSSYQTQVYTDLQADLTSDGTYNITLETYATNDLQYQTVAKRPTDFIFVLDTSGSMSSQDCNGYHRHNSFDLEAAAGTTDAAGITNNSSNSNTTATYTGNMWIQHSDGELCRVTCRVQGDGREYIFPSYVYYQRVYLWYTHPDGTVYYFHVNSNNLSGTWTTTPATYDQSIRIGASSKGDRAGRNVFEGVCYEKRSNSSRLSNMQLAVNQLTWKIQEKAAADNLDHRIAVVQYGSNANGNWTNTGMYTNTSTSMVACTGYNTISAANLQNAFHSVSQFDNVKNIVNNLTASGDTFVDYGMDMANHIIMQNGANYKADGNRSACVIMITDGCPGFGGDDSSTATTVANAAISTAYNLKRNGAYVYTVQMGNNSMSGFDMDQYMRYLSSEYTGASSLDSSGELNVKEIDYYMQVDAGASFDLTTFVNDVFNSVTSNATNAIASLDANSILREHLTDAFDLTNASIKCETAKSKYDGIGRLYFDPPVTASYTPSLDRANNNIELTGYDYSAKNVSKANSDNGNGEKLIITISGVIADADAELLNTSINDTVLTALYEDSNLMSSNLPVKRFPTYHFSIPEYTYYMDYDIPMYDSDINGTLCSVDSTLKKQSTYKTSLSTGNMGIQFVNNNLDMIYTLNSQAGLTEKLSKGYVLIQRDDGSYDWFRLNIVPASTVYYEENKMDVLDGTQNFTEWTQDGSFDDKYQSLSTENDVFGSDSTYYNSTEKFSLGTHKKVTVTSSSKRSDTQTFTFTGTGFDLISACGNNTGIQTVTVKQHQSDGSMKIVKVFMVDTFYNDSTYGTVYQVPVVQFKGDYATYTVETTAAYYSFAGALNTQSTDTYAVEGTELEATTAVADTFSTDELFAQVGMDELIGQEVELIWMDDDSVLNGGTGVEGATLSTQADGTTSVSLDNYIDGFRIYNPVDYNDEYIVSEKNATFYSVIDAITAGGMGGDSFAGYLEGGTTGSVFGDYLTSGGPKYEVYLAPGNSIAFRFKASWGELPPRAMVSVRAASGSPKAKFASSANLTHAFETGVLSGSETYYDITDNALGVGDDSSFVLTVTNTGSSGLLAVDNIKLTNASLVPINGVSLAELNDIISTQAVEFNPFEEKTENHIFAEAPADNPAIDPEGSIPVLSYQPSDDDNIGEDNGNADIIPDVEEPEECLLKTFFNKVVAFFKNIFSYIKNLIPIF